MSEWIVNLDTKSPIPLYEQICGYFKKEIQEGRLAAEKRLPSSRALAGNLQVSRSTVDLAYDQLVAEGYIESKPYKGYFVCEIENLYYRKEEKKPKAIEKLLLPGFSEEDCICDFAPNGIAPGSFPHTIWKKLSRQILAEESDELYMLGNPWGEISLRRSIAEYLYQARGMRCKAEQILVGAGNDYLLMLLCVVLGAHRTAAMENPSYPSARHVFLQMGYELRTVSQDEQGMRVEELEASGAEIAYVMPSHQFPAGMVMPLKRRMALLQWASGGNRYIIEDDYDSEFRYKGSPIPALQGFDQDDKVIYLGTFSKSIAPSIRISYMVLPEHLAEKYLTMKSPFSVTVSKTDQRILERFLGEGHYEKHLNRVRSIYRGKHDRMLFHLKEMSDICTFSGEYAGVHLLVHFHNGLTEHEAVARAAEAGIRVYGLSDYRADGAGKESATVLLGYATLSDEVLDKGMECLKRVWA